MQTNDGKKELMSGRCGSSERTDLTGQKVTSRGKNRSLHWIRILGQYRPTLWNVWTVQYRHWRRPWSAAGHSYWSLVNPCKSNKRDQILC